jgi:2-polyprenyl-3-methyl-5-hydroxy-6-metoxy-1,4-benzoquinol methylase
MKRIIGRKMASDQTKDYGSFKVPTLNFDLLDVNAQLFRFRWASDIVDNLRASGVMTYRLLDIGTYNGALSAIMARKHLNPEDSTSPTMIVESLETHKESFEAADALAKVVRDKGYTMTVHNTRFEDFESDIKYDMIVCFEMLEHTKDPLFCVEKMYDMLEIGGYLLLTVPEERGVFGKTDKNCWHYWTSTVQSLVSVLFYDDKKWQIRQCFEGQDTLIHCMVKKLTYQ